MKAKTKTVEAAEPEVMSKSKSTRIAVQNNGQLPALPQEWEDELAKEATDAAANEAVEIAAFSTRAGVLSYNDQPMPNNEVSVIVLCAGYSHALYINKFDPSNIVSPACFALGLEEDGMGPHENSFKPQGVGSEDVAGTFCKVGDQVCEFAEWGSDTNSPSGRGKACKHTRRLAVISETALESGIAEASPVLFNVPVTSGGAWSTYVQKLAAAKRPAWSVITRIKVTPDPKKQFVVSFEAVDVIQDTEQLAAIREAIALGKKLVLTPFSPMTKEQYDAIQAEKNKPVKPRKF